MSTIKKNLLFSGIFISVIYSAVSAQPLPSGHGYALIFPKAGDGFAANILRIEKDSLVIYTNDFKYIAKKDVGKILLHPKKESGKGFTIGSIVGIYAMNYWLGTANGQPGAFLWNEPYGGKYNNASNTSGALEVVGIGILGVAVGGGLGYLLDLGRESNSETVYIFGGTPEMQEEEWVKVADVLDHKSVHGKLHFVVSGGLVSDPVSHSYFDQLSASGYDMNSFNNTFFSSGIIFFSNGSTSNTIGTNLAAYQKLQTPSDFNWLRTVTLTYSVTDEIEVGLCYALLGQPSTINTKQIETRDSSITTNSTAFVGQRLDGKGYYATCGYYKYFGKNEELELTLTGGLGMANISFDLNGQYDFSSFSLGFNSVQQDNVSIRKTNFSAMISAGLTYYLYDAFSIGLKANYFYVGKSSARGMPFVFIQDQDLNFSTADIGFTIGFHF